MAAGNTQEEADAAAAHAMEQDSPQPLREPEAAGEQTASGHSRVSGPSRDEEADDAHGGAEQEVEHGPREGLEAQEVREEEGYHADEEEEGQEEEEGYDAEMEEDAEEEDELPDDTTTVDPPYTISLIKKLMSQRSNAEKKFSGKQSVNAGDGKSKLPVNEGPWEESGCILWDLASSKPEAELMIENLVLQVLLSNLHVAKSSRVKEICLGIMATLACHKSLVSAICLENGLIATVVEQLFLDDTSCLSETFRLLAAILNGSASVSWAESLFPDKILSRILLIVGNTTSSELLKQGIVFISNIIDHQDANAMLIQPLLKVGLVDYATRLLATEIKKSPEEKLYRSDCLIMILHLMEELSAIHSVVEVMSSNVQLIELLVNMVKSPDKLEVATYSASVVIIIESILINGRHLVPMLYHDLSLLEGLFVILPQVSDDSHARYAVWCTLTCLLAPVREVEMNSASLDQFASLFVGMFTLIEDDLETHHIDDEATDNAFIKGWTYTCLRAIGFVMDRWIREKESTSEKDAPVTQSSIDNAYKVMNYCLKNLPDP